MPRLKQIDVLRALAVFLVFGRHMVPCPAEESALLHRITEVWSRGGWIGVDLFFVLSGFLVSGLLFGEYERNSTVNIRRFLIRRGFKIYPAFWVLISATVAMRLLRHHSVPAKALMAEVLFFQNYGSALWDHTWSLAVEEHFYILLALLILLLASRRAAKPFAVIPIAFVFVAIGCLALRVLDARGVEFELKSHLFPSHLRLDSLFFGVLLAYVFHRNPTRFFLAARRWRYLLLATGLLLLLPAFIYPLESTPFIYTYGLSIFYLGSGCLLVSALGFPDFKRRPAHGIAYIGSHSYSVYLWHLPVMSSGAAIAASVLSVHNNWIIYAFVCILGSIAVGIAMALAIEFPVIRLRERFFPSRVSPLSN